MAFKPSMLDIRYHLFYFCAIFLMLGFGILIGASVIGPAQVRRQSLAIANLRMAANQVVQDRDQARDRLAKDESALSLLRPGLVRGKLAGKRVVIVQTGDYPEATEAATLALGDSGAAVEATVTLTEKWASLTPKQREVLHVLAVGSDPANQNAALLAALASEMMQGTAASASALTHSKAVPIELLQQQGLITVSGDLTLPCRMFVIVGGVHDDTMLAALDTPLLSGLKASAPTVIIVGSEPSFAAVSSIPAFQNAGIATVDCIDLPLGQLALPFALRGETGDYGIKPTAKQQIPAAVGGQATL